MQFVDTNVLLYAVSRHPDEQVKAQRANEILDGRDVALSVQVLQEFYFQATHDRRTYRLTHEQAVGTVRSFGAFPTQETTVALALAAMEARQRFNISYWDAAILEAARALGCAVVLSEDLSDGQDYAGVRVQNPFSAC
ncbi:MAG TPA: PIN domain-containing protein [Solirubrobacteraceae bacterium]